MKLLVVDSDRDMVEMLTGWLKTHGYEVQHAFSIERARRLWVEHRPDLVIMDTLVDNADALAMCRELRCAHDALVLAVPNSRDMNVEVECLDAGADAYLPKPFHPKQLLAHIRALSRRVRTTLQRNPSSIIEVGAIKVDSLRHEVRTPTGMTVRLTPTESRVLHILAANANDICTLGQIVTHVWGFGDAGDTYLIKAHIRHLREKIEPDPSNPRYIVTVPGVGYCLKRLAALPAAAEPTASEILAELVTLEELEEDEAPAPGLLAKPAADQRVANADVAPEAAPQREPSVKRARGMLDLGSGHASFSY